MNRKRLTLIIATLLVAAMALTLVGCGGSSGSPKALLESFFDSIDKQDVNKFLNCFEKDTREDLLDEVDKDEIKDLLEELDGTLADEFGDKWRKQIKIGKAEKGDTDDDITYYDVEITMKDEDGEESEDTIQVIKFKGKYYLDENSMAGMM